ncbi:MAG: transposase [Verrucomicrobia bacterium]|nr:transposase [Verrucomicrobiota bacterium]
MKAGGKPAPDGGAADLRDDAKRVSGHGISTRYWRDLFKRTLRRAAGQERFTRMELYLPEKPALKNPIRRAGPPPAFIHPWQHRSWIFPRDPQFDSKAGLVMDLYQGCWQDQPLGSDEYVISADEKTSLQARVRLHPTQPTEAGQCMRVEFEYERGGALAYLAAWDVRRAKSFDRCESTTGIAPFDGLVQQVMSQEPYRHAKRVFWIVDNGSSYRGQASCQRLGKTYSNLILVHLPVHASWLNQVEINFSVVQRKVLSPNDFSSLDAVAKRLLEFQSYYEQIAKPFKWKFTRVELKALVKKLNARSTSLLAA